MAVSRKKKEADLAALSVQLGKAVSVVFVRNTGLSVEALSELRRNLRKVANEFKIPKKTLLQIAMKEHDFPEVSAEILEGAVGIAFSYDDEVAPAKILADFAKKNDKLELLGGVLDKKRLLGKSEVVALAKIPSKDQLIAQFVGTCKAPLSGLHNVLHGSIRGLVQVLSQIEKQKAAA